MALPAAVNLLGKNLASALIDCNLNGWAGSLTAINVKKEEPGLHKCFHNNPRSAQIFNNLGDAAG